MTQPNDERSDRVDEEVDHLKDDADAMDRYDRAIPLPPPEGDDDDGVGQITGLVP